MKTTPLLNPFLLPSVRRAIQSILASFRFPEADPGALPSADGLYAFEVGRLQNSRPNEPEETGGNVGTSSLRRRAGEPPLPIPLGLHPDCTRAHWTTAWQRPVHQYAVGCSSNPTPMENRAPASAPPSLQPGGTHQSNEPDQSANPLPLPADPATAFGEIVEGCCVVWPERLSPERVVVGIAELVSAALVVSGAVVLAQWTALS